jgi:glycosyltransferase involved in cell wall biosynthesis
MNSESKVVWVVGPPINNSGGIGSLFTYAVPCFPNSIKVKFLDTRGYTERAFYSIVPLVKVLIRLIAARVRNQLDLVHVNVGGGYSLYRKALVVFLSTRILQLPTSIHFHGASNSDFIFRQKFLLKLFLLHCINSCDAVIVLGTRTYSEMLEIGVRPSNLKVLRMGVPDLQRAFQGNEFSLNQQSKSNPVILFAGELGTRKGLLETLQSLSDQKLQDLKFIVAGGGDFQKWKEIAIQLGVDKRVAFIGLRSYQEIHQYFGIVDALILASKAEGLPVSVMECFSAGKIPIINLSGNLMDVATDSNAILISKPGTIEITDALHKFKNLCESAKHEEVSRNSRGTWEKFFNVEETTLVLTQLWTSIILKDGKRET